MGYKTYDCPVERRCGGCEWLAVPYPIQLRRKQETVADLFSGWAGSAELFPIIGMDEPLHYRHKIIVPFAQGKGRSLRYGLYAKGSHRIVTRPDGCLMEDRLAGPILESIARIGGSLRIRAYDEETQSGFLRHVLIRTGFHTREVLVCLVCASEEFRRGRQFTRKLMGTHPEITTLVMNVNSRKTNVVLGQSERVLAGKGWIVDELLGYRFRISSSSFYQVNPAQTEKLYSEAIALADLDGEKTILDAYCGTGTIGIIASRDAGGLIGVESNARAVRDAMANAKDNGIANAHFEHDDAGGFMERLAADGGGVDVVFMDPPRSGSDERFLGSLCHMAPDRVVYISCNPKTQARDAEFLCRNGYNLDVLQPVDMFPHTKHVECVACFTHR